MEHGTDVELKARFHGLKHFFTVPRIVTLAIVVLLAVLAGLFVPRFFTVNNLLNIIVQTSPIGLMAIGITFVFITGGIDLSQPAVMAMAAVLGAMYMVATGNAFIGSLITVAVAMGVGLFNGFAVAKLKMIPFVVTLSMMVVAGGLAVWFTDATSVYGLPEGFINLLTGSLGPIPVPVIILIVFTAIGHFFLSKTIFGRKIFAVGINIEAAKVSGIRSTRILLSVYVVSGFFAGIAGILSTARLGSAAPSMGAETMVLDVVSSAVIGGVSIYGGVGTILGAVFGALFITVISNVMNLIGVSFYTTLVVKGMIIVLATGLDAFRKRMSVTSR